MTAGKVLESPSEDEVVTESEVINAQQKASETIDEIVAIDEQASKEMRRLTTILSRLAPVSNVSVEEITDEDENNEINMELSAIGKYQAERYKKMMKCIEEKMDFHKENLQLIWREQKDILDYQALKEIRYDMEAIPSWPENLPYSKFKPDLLS